MNFNEGMVELSQLCKGKDWFFDIGTDTFGNYVVYAKFMNYDVLTFVPNEMAGKRVLVHFAASKLANKDQFTETHSWSSRAPEVLSPEPLDVVSEVVGSVEEEKSIRYLQDELDRLEKQCGSNMLQDIFYEVHDDKNAVTNLRAKFPDVHRSLLKLYKEYGFDVIYEELDG